MSEHNERGIELNYFGDEYYLHSMDNVNSGYWHKWKAIY